MGGIPSGVKGASQRVQVKQDGYPKGMLAFEMLYAGISCRCHTGEVLGYCFGTTFYGTVQPLCLEGPESNLGAVWARFVLVTSILLFFRFSTLLMRNSMARPIAQK